MPEAKRRFSAQVIRLLHSGSADFLKRRFADALMKGDDKTAYRLQDWVNVAMNGHLANSRSVQAWINRPKVR